MYSPEFITQVESLKTVLDQLDELAMSALREYMSSGDAKDREMEKRIHRARRAIVKAIAELDQSTFD